jgi:threonine dehydratase
VYLDGAHLHGSRNRTGGGYHLGRCFNSERSAPGRAFRGQNEMSQVHLDSAAAERRIRPHVLETPQRRSSWLSERTRANVFSSSRTFKRRAHSSCAVRPTSSSFLSPAQAAAGVLTASSGNHALAAATMARKLGIAADVFVSEHINPQRLAAIQSLGVHVNKVSGDALAAEHAARKRAKV